MSTRRLVSLMRGIGYKALPPEEAKQLAELDALQDDPVEAPPELSPKADISRFFGGAIRVTGGVDG